MKPTTLKKTQPTVEVQESSETTPPPGAAGPTPPPGRFRFNRFLAALACVWVGVIVAVWFGLHPLFDIEFPLYPPEITGRIAGALGGFLLDVVFLGLCGLAS